MIEEMRKNRHTVEISQCVSPVSSEIIRSGCCKILMGFGIVLTMDADRVFREAEDCRPSIMYQSYEKLTNRDPRSEARTVRTDFDPLRINWSNRGSVKEPKFNNVDQIQAYFTDHGEKWLYGGGFHAINKLLVDYASAARKIRKIVAFALGSLRYNVVNGSLNVARPATQHAMVLGIASVLRETHGREIKCYLQDPIYNSVDKEFLESKGFTILQDPKGFLEVDEETLVVSISPNVPVKQIIADMPWPAAMIWNTVKPEKDECTEWKTEVIRGSPMRVS
jgi:hypothetical protein